MLGILVALAVSLACGFLNGALIAWLRVPAIIATLGTQGLFLGISIIITKGHGIGGFPLPFLFIGNGSLAGIPMQFIVFIAVALLVALVLTRTRQGFAMVMVGSNPLASRFSGLSNEAVLIRTYLLTGLLSGVAAIIIISGVNSIRPGYGSEYLLLSVLIAILGGTDPAGGFGTVLGVTLAVFILQILQSGLNILDFSPFFKKFIWGLLLLLVMVFHYFLRLATPAAGRAPLRGRRAAGRWPAWPGRRRRRHERAGTCWASTRAPRASGRGSSTRPAGASASGSAPTAPSTATRAGPSRARATGTRRWWTPSARRWRPAAWTRGRCGGSASTAPPARWSSWTAAASRCATR